MTGPHFRDYHLLLDEQAAPVLATIDPIAERVGKLGSTTLRSVGHIASLQRATDNIAPRESGERRRGKVTKRTCGTHHLS